jgi:alpha-beta hydrolase superfamily lysophospholipase
MMEVPDKIEGALMRHFGKERFKRILYGIAHTSYYLPIAFTKGRAAIFHGYTGHSEQPSIKHLVHMLKNTMHFTVFTCDFPDHGLSSDPEKPSDFGKIKSFLRWIHTVRIATYQVLKLRADKQLGVFLIGESGGALAIVRFLQLHPEVQKYLAGVVILAIPLEVDQNAAEWVQRHKRLLEPVFNFLALFFPNFPIADLPDGDKTDPLEYHGRVKAGTAKEIRSAVFDARAREAMEKITVPILFIHSDSDGVALPEHVEIAYRSVATPADKKEFIVYTGAPHRVLHHAVKDIEQWIAKRNAAKDWVPFQQEGLINDVVELPSIWFFAITKTLQLFLRILVRWKKKITTIFE